jgi:hypothetical protein
MKLLRVKRSLLSSAPTSALQRAATYTSSGFSFIKRLQHQSKHNEEQHSHSTYQTMSETEAAAAPAATDAPKKKGGAGGKKTEKKATKEPERRSARAKKAPAADTMTAPAVKAAA